MKRRRFLANKFYRYRCSQCRKWRRLRKPLSEYIRAPRCLWCGSEKFYKVEKRKQVTCDCPRLWFPHRFEPGRCHSLAESDYKRRRLSKATGLRIREIVSRPADPELVPAWVFED